MSADRTADPAGARAKVAVFGEHDDKTLAQLRDVASRADRAALMADGHLGYVMPIGGVAAYHDTVSVVGVGFDIACGNAAIRTDLTFEKNLDVITRLPSVFTRSGSSAPET